MSQDIKKVVIPVAGLGTRFLPFTKAVPKELTPIGTTPILHYVMEEAAASGIDEAILITSPIKTAIEEYFSMNTAYCKELKGAGKDTKIANLRKLTERMKITYIEQHDPKGLGDAILRSKKAVGDEPFCIILPDQIFVSKIPCCKQMIDSFKKTGTCINAVERVPKNKISSYGICDIPGGIEKLMKPKRIIEKPNPENSPSDIAVMGRYLMTPEVFEILEKLPAGKNGEIQLADAQNELAQQGRLHALLYEGFQFDTGDEWGFLQANLYLALSKYAKETGAFLDWLNTKVLS